MMNLPTSTAEIMDWPWSKLEPFYRELADAALNGSNASDWLAEWSHLAELIQETYKRLYVATTVDTTDAAAEARYNRFLDEIFPNAEAIEQELKNKLLHSGVQPAGFEIPLRNMRAEAELFRLENLPLLAQEIKLSSEYDKISGAQTVKWDGQELTIQQLVRVYQQDDRQVREAAWRMGAERQLADRQAINELWCKLLVLRQQIAANAGFSDFRSYRWKQFLRFDYSPQDCQRFHQAIEEAVVPAAERIYEKRRRHLGVDTLRPWDLEVDPSGRPPLRPFRTIEELESKTEAIFRQVDPQLGEYFTIMRREGLLDLDNRKGKAPGGYCEGFPLVKRPFIFANAVGTHDDVQTLLHEGGHAFHEFEYGRLPYIQQRQVGNEFGEVASMGMELLASPYLEAERGGFYSPQDAARARIEHLEKSLLFWPYMAVVDAFQHWVYMNPQAALDTANCDAQWAALWQRFMRGIDYRGLENQMCTGWHNKLHIHQIPFYYVEYGMALLGSVQVWRNALQDQAGAVAAYRRALSLGGTQPLPVLFQTAGARFQFDTATLQEAVDLMVDKIEKLEAILS